MTGKTNKNEKKVNKDKEPEHRKQAKTKKKKPMVHSMAVKFTGRFSLRMLGTIIALNLLFGAVAFCFMVLHWNDETDYIFRNASGIHSVAEVENLLDEDMTLSVGKSANNTGFKINFFGKDNYNTVNYLYFSTKTQHTLVFSRYSPAYGFTVDLNVYADAFRAVMAALVFFIIEGICYIIDIIRWAVVTRRTLKPIDELEKAAQLLQEHSTVGGLDLLAGEINTIEATKLDFRLSVEEAPDELKGLTEAINAMLARVDEAYCSQMRFVSDASHELRTPIAVIQGYANLLDRWGKDDPKTLNESVVAIKHEAESMKNLVEHLLFLARGDNDRMVLNMEVLDLKELVEEVVRDTRLIDHVHKIRCNVQEGVKIRGDAGLIRQAVRILVDNSIKYTPEGELISVSVYAEGDMAKVKVQDNGIGMVPEDLPYIFDRFYRSDESRARTTGGTGLGLSIAKWIVHRHGGYFEVLSRKDFGSRFIMNLPLL